MNKMDKVIEKILNKTYSLKKVIKNNQRSEVLLIELENREYVLKFPKEKNTRKWQRFLSLFRGSESKREFYNYYKVLENGFNGPKPIIYWEKKKFGMVVDSFLLMEYIDGRSATVEDLKLIDKTLSKIHSKGFLHGDSQLSNFMIKNDEVYLIDIKLSKNIYGKFGAIYEYIYLEESCFQDIDVFEKKSIYYKMAKGFNRYLHWYGDFRKIIKRKGK